MPIDVMLILKIAAIGMLVAILNPVLRHSGREELTMFTTIAGLIIVLLMIINLVNDLFTSVRTMFQIY